MSLNFFQKGHSVFFKGENQPTPQPETTPKWQLPRNDSNMPIGLFKGQTENCYRTIMIENPLSTDNIKEIITEYRCIVENSAERTTEVVLVVYPNEIDGITNCHVIWKFRNRNFEEQESHASVLIGNIYQDLLINNEEYFNWVMKNLLDYHLIKGIIGNNNDSSIGTYICDIRYDENKYSIEFDTQKEEQCRTNKEIVKQQNLLHILIDARNKEVMERSDYRGREI